MTPNMISDEFWNKLTNDYPLMGFSIDTHTQVNTLKQLSASILSDLDSSMGTDTIDFTVFNNVYGMFWLWVLGSYEVVRTIDQAHKCLSDPFAKKVHSFKKKIAKLRIPFAKQEYEGAKSKQPIHGETSIYGVDTKAHDFFFKVKEDIFSVRAILAEFCQLFEEISQKDILENHRVFLMK
jgi:hypothetical protein